MDVSDARATDVRLAELIASLSLSLRDHLALYPSDRSGSVCGRGLSANPISTAGFERRHNAPLRSGSEDEFQEALLRDIPPTPEQQTAILAANRTGRPFAETS